MILLNSWSEYKIEKLDFVNSDPEFNTFAAMNPFILMEANQDEAKEFGSDVKNIFSKSQFRKSISRFPRLFKLQSELSVRQFLIFSIAKMYL